MVTTASRRIVQRVPALHVLALLAEGRLPRLAPDVDSMGVTGPSRAATLSEVSALTWLLCGPVASPYGVAATWDRFDFHTGTDVREIVHVAGSTRAVCALVTCIADQAKSEGKRAVGVIDVENVAMGNALGRLGATKATRYFWEDRRP